MAFTGMSGIIEPLTTLVDGTPSYTNNTGTVEPNGIISYRLEICNPTGGSLTNLTINDTLTGLPEGATIVGAKINGADVDVTTVGTLPDLVFTIAEIESDTCAAIIYEIELPIGTAADVVINNKATASYTKPNPAYNPDDPNNTEPETITGTLTSEPIAITTADEKELESSKFGPDHVVIGEPFEYNINFANNTGEEADVNKITDTLPDNFVLEPSIGADNPVVQIVGDANPLVYGTDYTVTQNGNDLEITPVAGGTLTIPDGKTLRVTVKGKVTA